MRLNGSARVAAVVCAVLTACAARPTAIHGGAPAVRTVPRPAVPRAAQGGDTSEAPMPTRATIVRPMWVSGTGRPAGLRHRGDWEPVDALAVVHHWEWAQSIARLARIASRWADVRILVAGDEVAPPRVASRERGRTTVRVLRLNTDTPWIRDYGPIQVFDGKQPRWLDFGYAEDRERDDRVPIALASHFEVPVRVEADRLDGGAIASNGRGLCAMTDLNLSESGYTADDPAVSVFAARLGCSVLAVLPALPEEETGHVDVFVQFFSPSSVGVGWADPSAHPELALALDTAASTLDAVANAHGEPLTIHRIPMTARDGTFYSYLNGTPVGPVFFAPTYTAVDPKTQRVALSLLQRAMPRRHIIPIPAEEMIGYGGAVHCITTGLSVDRTGTFEIDESPGAKWLSRLGLLP